MAFYPYRHEGGDDSGEVRDFIITNSQTVTIGDAIRLVAGFAQRAAAGNRVMGVVVGIGKRLGDNVNDTFLPLDTDAAGSVSGTRTGNPGVIGSETYAAAADNQTVDRVAVRVIISPSQEYYNLADANLLAAHVGRYFDCVAASNQVNVASVGNDGQFVLMDRDPHNDGVATKGVFRIAEHALQLG
jgi:hypothetical protein